MAMMAMYGHIWPCMGIYDRIWQCMATECADHILNTTKPIGFTEYRTRGSVPQATLSICWDADGFDSARQAFTLIDGRKTWWVCSEGTSLLKALPFKLV